MFKWFKRKNAQTEVDKTKGTHKLNAGDVAVEVDGKKITVAELEQAMIDHEAEQAEIAKREELESNMEPISMDETFTASNGKEYKVGDLVANFKARQAKKNAADPEAAKAAEAKANALKARANACGLAENATEEEIVKAETDKKNADDAAAAKDKEEKDKKENARKQGKEFFKGLQTAQNSVEAPTSTVGKSRKERADGWAKRNKKNK